MPTHKSGHRKRNAVVLADNESSADRASLAFTAKAAARKWFEKNENNIFRDPLYADNIEVSHKGYVYEVKFSELIHRIIEDMEKMHLDFGGYAVPQGYTTKETAGNGIMLISVERHGVLVGIRGLQKETVSNLRKYDMLMFGQRVGTYRFDDISGDRYELTWSKGVREMGSGPFTASTPAAEALETLFKEITSALLNL